MSEVKNAAQRALEGVSAGSNVLTTIEGASLEAKRATFSAIANAEKLSDNIGSVINLTNVVMQAIEVNDETAEHGFIDAVRVVLLDDQGKSYSAISKGLVGSINDLFAIFGLPSAWTEPIPVTVVEQTSRSGYQFMKLELAEVTN